ncbi:MAG: hypothetical protein ACJAV2_002922 [Myxococcota bacterium]|jgi:hypothetical protein
MFVVLTAALAGCSETGFTPDDSVAGQPNPPDLTAPLVVDRLIQSPEQTIDILFVMDTSCSMIEEQVALDANMPSFMQFFLDSGLDYHLGVVSTNMDDRYQDAGLLTRAADGSRFISPDTPSPFETFTELAVLGTDGHAEEQGRRAAWTAIELFGATENRAFYREEATLSVVVISDEDDQSGDNPIALPDFVSWLDGLKSGDAGQTSFSAIVADTDRCASVPGNVGDEYMDAVQSTGGVLWSICTDRWDLALEQLGMQAAGIRREFFLSQVPVPGTLTIQVRWPDGTEIPYTLVDVPTPSPQWIDGGAPFEVTYDRSRNSVRFWEQLPPPLSEMVATYESLANNPVGPDDQESEGTDSVD